METMSVPHGQTKPFPWVAITLFFSSHLFDSMARLSLLSYLPQAIHEFHFAWRDVGRYQGYVIAAYIAAYSISSLLHGPLLDNFSRKMTFVWTNIGLGVCTILFGFSSNITWMLMTRSAAGIFCGIKLCIRVMLYDLRDSADQVYSMAYTLTASVNVAIALGPLIGGFLSLPTHQYPTMFPAHSIWDRWPILVPNMLLGLALIVTGILSWIMLPSVKKVDKERQDHDESQNESPMLSTSGQGKQGHVKYFDIIALSRAWKLLRNTNFVHAAILYTFVKSSTESFRTLFSVWTGVSKAKGGLGYSPAAASLFYVLPGLVTCFFDVTCLGWFNKRFGLRGSYIFWNFLRMFVVMTLVLLQHIEYKFFFFAVCSAAVAAIQLSLSGAKVSSYVFVNLSVEADEVGTGNAITEFVGNLMAAASQAVVGFLFSWALLHEEHQLEKADSTGFPFNRTLPFYMVGLLSLLGGCWGIYIRNVSKNITD